MPTLALPAPCGPAVHRVIGGDPAYGAIHDLSRMDSIALVRAGIPAQLLAALARDMHIAKETLYGWIGIPRATANRKLKAAAALSPDESERALGVARLVGQVQQLVAESGQPQGFDAAQWTAVWLERPNAALAGQPPGAFMDTADGRALVSSLVAQMQSGAYA